ncbi:MAG TPA: NAD(P)-dependent oxidoreductase [Steroidobacteraceae bacterium]|nr:NAD(P)-dependent oxidoreductase [Steroidobacteraceae bacterium]
MIPDVSTIAFLGLGRMGAGMAARILAAGHRLHVYNRTAGRAATLLDHGARVFPTPGAACAGADAIISMVSDDAASRAIWCGPDGALTAVAPGALAIECSTLSHAWVMELAAQAGSRGLRYVDAPVTGLPDAAIAGTLTLLVGAEAADLTAVRTLLASFARDVIHFGGVGSGTAYKLIINLLGAVQIASVAESIAIAERAGLDLRQVTQAIASGQAASPQVVRNSRRMLAGDYRTLRPRVCGTAGHRQSLWSTGRARLHDTTGDGPPGCE